MTDTSNADFLRIYQAMACHDVGSGDLLLDATTADMHCEHLHAFAGGMGAYAMDQANRAGLLRLLLDARRKAVLDEAHFSAILDEIETVAGRRHVLEVLRDMVMAHDATHDLMGRLAQPGRCSGSRYGVAPDELARFLRGETSGQGPLVREFMGRLDVQRELPSMGKAARVYEFSWGFIVEQHGVWNFYAADVWRAGTAHYYERFSMAWRALAAPVLEQAVQQARNNFYLSVDDGGGAFACISLACVDDRRGERLAREWVSHVFVATLWPQMLQRVLDPHHVFALEVQCA